MQSTRTTLQTTASENDSPHELLYHCLRERRYCDVLIDQQAGFPFREEIEALDDAIGRTAILNDRMFKDSPGDAPLLVRLHWKESALAEKFLTHALEEANDFSLQTRSVCAFLFSSLDQAGLVKRLTRQLSAHVRSYGDIYFRYFDPRIMHHLPRLLTSDQLAGLLSGVGHWGYVTWNGRFNVIDEISSESPLYAPNFAREEWECVARTEAIHMTQRTLFSVSHPLAEDADARIEAHLILAEKAGLAVPLDQTTFAAFCMKFGDAFIRHPKTTASVELAKTHGIPLTEILEQQAGMCLEAAFINSSSV